MNKFKTSSCIWFTDTALDTVCTQAARCECYAGSINRRV